MNIISIVKLRQLIQDMHNTISIITLKEEETLILINLKFNDKL